MLTPPSAVRTVLRVVAWTLVSVAVLVALWTMPLHDGDEVANTAATFAALLTGFHPANYTHPAGATFLGAAALDAIGLLWTLGGPLGSPVALADLLIAHTWLCLLVLRTLSFAAWILALCVLARVARRLAPESHAQPHLVCLLVLPVGLWQATSVSPYPLAMLCTLLAWILALRPSRLRAALCGLALGAGIGTHLFAGLWLPFVVALLTLRRPDRARTLAALALGLAAGILLSNPRLALDWPLYEAQLRYRTGAIDAPEFASAEGTSPLSYLTWLLAGWPIGMVGGAVYLARRGRGRAPPGPIVASLLTGLAILVLLSVLRTRYERYLIWIIPLVTPAASLGLADLQAWLGDRLRWRLASCGLPALLVGQSALVVAGLFGTAEAAFPPVEPSALLSRWVATYTKPGDSIALRVMIGRHVETALAYRPLDPALDGALRDALAALAPARSLDVAPSGTPSAGEWTVRITLARDCGPNPDALCAAAGGLRLRAGRAPISPAESP